MRREPLRRVDPPAPPPGDRPRRPAGVTIVALFYIVLGAHSLAIGLYLAGGPGIALPFPQLLAAYPNFVRDYGLALLAMSVPFFVDGVALLRRRWWARWLTLAIAPLHLVGPPFLLGGMLFALAVNAYLFGSGAAQAALRRPAARNEAKA
jgi:hypothetical protein